MTKLTQVADTCEVLPYIPSQSQPVVYKGNLLQYFYYNEFFIKKII